MEKKSLFILTDNEFAKFRFAKKNKNKGTKEPDYKSNDLKFGKIAKGNSSLQKEFNKGYKNA